MRDRALADELCAVQAPTCLGLHHAVLHEIVGEELQLKGAMQVA